MKNFIKSIGLIFYSGDFYNKIKDEKVENGIVFLLKILVFLGICLGIMGIIALFIFSPMLKREVSKLVESNFPNDLVVTVKDGKMTTNTNEPFFIKIPESERESFAKENIFAILPNENVDMSILSKYKTILAMTEDGFIGENNDKGEIRIFKYGKISFVATKEVVLQKISFIFPFFLGFIFLCFIMVVIIFVFFNIIFHLIWLFLIALLIWGFLRLKKINISYKQSYKIGMYAIVPLLFLEILAIPLGFSGKLFTTAIILLVVLVVTHNWKKEDIENKIILEEVKNI